MTSPLPVHHGYADSLLDVHWAANIAAAASRGLEAQPDWSHTNLLVQDGLLLGRPLPDGRCAGLDPRTLTLLLGDEKLALEGRTVGDGISWLSEQLGTKTELLDHELPPRSADAPLSLHGAEEQIAYWFNLAQRLLGGIAETGGGGEVRIWPHHFDIATLIELGGSGEEARSINVGLSPGDGSYSEPYWYVTPWPLSTSSLPPLTLGSWHTEGFTAAVLPASSHDPNELEQQAAVFLRDSVVVCREIVA